MGYTADCKLTYEGKAYSGKAMLETDYLEFKGDLKLKVSFKSITAAAMEKEALQVKFDGRAALFDVGAQSEKWLQKILNPKSLLDKLGVKPEHKVCVLKIADESFLADLEKRVAKFSTRLVSECDVIFLGTEKESDLAALGRCKESLKKDGAIWVVNPKGQKSFNENHVLAAGKKAGLVDVKVAKFSETHTAHRFVIPKAQR
ncbi:MAG: hypothetical protein ACREOI_21930 [bacterium]